MTATAVYVYAVMAAAGDLADVRGIAGAPVRAITRDGLAAVVSTVDADEFGEAALRRNLEDLAWLEQVARAHHRVVDAVAGQSPAAPLRLATIYLGDDSVQAMLGEQNARFTAILDRIRGRAEWGVKAYGAPQAAGVPPEPSAAGPGTSYLLRRRAERDHAARSLQVAREQAKQVHERLARLAVASRVYPPQDPRLSGQRDEMVLNAAYLVDDRDGAAVRELADSCDVPALRLELTGPWAPYSFAEPDDA